MQRIRIFLLKKVGRQAAEEGSKEAVGKPIEKVFKSYSRHGKKKKR